VGSRSAHRPLHAFEDSVAQTHAGDLKMVTEWPPMVPDDDASSVVVSLFATVAPAAKVSVSPSVL